MAKGHLILQPSVNSNGFDFHTSVLFEHLRVSPPRGCWMGRQGTQTNCGVLEGHNASQFYTLVTRQVYLDGIYTHITSNIPTIVLVGIGMGHFTNSSGHATCAIISREVFSEICVCPSRWNSDTMFTLASWTSDENDSGGEEYKTGQVFRG